MAAGDVTPPVPPQPLLWVIIPLLAVFTAGCFTFWMWKRHRRARGSSSSRSWPEERVVGADGSVVRTSRRWGALAGSRSVEGLNELGEAPPPYEAKSPPPPPSPSDDEDDDDFDVEAAVRPPRYCQALPPGHQPPPPVHMAPPPPAVVAV